MLIKCPECGRDVSDTAPSCPGCGFVLKAPIVVATNLEKAKGIRKRSETGTKKPARWPLAIALSLAWWIVCALWYLSAKQAEEASTSAFWQGPLSQDSPGIASSMISAERSEHLSLAAAFLPLAALLIYLVVVTIADVFKPSDAD